MNNLRRLLGNVPVPLFAVLRFGMAVAFAAALSIAVVPAL
ncbi:MAG: hypothetical protein HW377_2720, partial [Actinobacteria bacterium]|nr:hypothetical protein [Actinomycetota bacterium]